MLKKIFLGIIIVHGLIHLLGFFKAYNIMGVNQISHLISKPVGILWLIVTGAFISVAILFVMNNYYWMILGLVAVVLSQILIFMIWKDAKFGTIPNVIILSILLLNMSVYYFEQSFKNDVAYNFIYNNRSNNEILTENAIIHLPTSVQKYLEYVGVIGKPPTENFYVIFDGIMRDKEKELSFTSEQYNFFQEPSRLFFMKGKMYGVTVPGYHRYMNQEASMDIKLFGWIHLVKEKNDIMFKSETVTTFVEMCYYAPSSLVDRRIVWEEIDDFTAKAYFTNKNTTIAATLFFNSEGQLINFISDDRYDISDMKNYRFSTPVSNYQNINGYNLPTDIELIWHYPEGEFVYGELNLKHIEYNLLNIK
jgi:hypothetical protein